MNRTVILLVGVSLVGCQEYHLDDPPTTAQLPALPPTVYPGDPGTEPPVPVAEAPVYANTSGQLFEVEPTDGVRSLIGDFVELGSGDAVEGFYDIAIDNQGMVVGGTRTSIYQIDPETAQVQLMCPTSTVPLGMAFTPDDRLLVAGEDAITHLDLTTCAETDVVYDSRYSTSGDIVGLPDGFIYWTVDAPDGRDGLVRIDPTTWQLYFLGEIPYDDLFGIGYADDQLFGFSRHGNTVAITPALAPAGQLVETSLLRNDTDISWWGATTNPVAW